MGGEGEGTTRRTRPPSPPLAQLKDDKFALALVEPHMLKHRSKEVKLLTACALAGAPALTSLELKALCMFLPKKVSFLYAPHQFLQRS